MNKEAFDLHTIPGMAWAFSLNTITITNELYSIIIWVFNKIWLRLKNDLLCSKIFAPRLFLEIWVSRNLSLRPSSIFCKLTSETEIIFVTDTCFPKICLQDRNLSGYFTSCKSQLIVNKSWLHFYSTSTTFYEPALRSWKISIFSGRSLWLTTSALSQKVRNQILSGMLPPHWLHINNGNPAAP